MHALRLNWGHVHYRDDGASGGRPIVFLNSLGTDLRMWDALLPELPRDCRFIRLDKRGHGLSALCGDRFSVDDLAADVLALLDHLQVAQAIFVGCSVGGLIAQAIAATAPERVRALVLSNTAGRIGTDESWRDRIAQVGSKGLAAMSDGVMERWFAPTFRAHPDCALWWTLLARSDPDGYAGCCEAIAAADYRDGLTAITAPTLVIAGGYDGATPPDLVLDMAEHIPGARAHVIAEAGHLPAIEAPVICGALITDFLKEPSLV